MKISKVYDARKMMNEGRQTVDIIDFFEPLAKIT